MRRAHVIEKQNGELSSSELIGRHPEIQKLRSKIASWSCYAGADRGDVRELLNLAAIALALWQSGGCVEGQQILDCAERFLEAATEFAVEEELRLTGSGTLGDGILEHAQEDVICAQSAFAVIADHQRVVEVVSHQYFGQTSKNWRAVADALVLDGLKALKDWRHPDIVAPVAHVRTRAGFIALERQNGGRIRYTDALSRERGTDVLSLDASSPTKDPYAAMIDPSNSDWDADICTRRDLEIVCDKNDLSDDAHLFAHTRYKNIPRADVPELFAIDPRRVEAARKQFERSLSQIQEGLSSYQEPISRPVPLRPASPRLVPPGGFKKKKKSCPKK